MNKNKATKSSKSFFYYVTGIGVLVCILAYLIPYRIMVNKTSELESENTILRTKLVTWKEYFENIDTYRADTEEIKESIQTDLEAYPSNVLEEDVVMLAVKLQDDTEATISNINISDKEQIYSIDSQKVLAIGMDTFTDMLTFNKLSASYVVDCDYTSIKDCVREIYEEKNRKGISSITISKNDDGSLIGSIDVDFYYLEGTTKEYTKPTIPAFESGIDNIFGIMNTVEDTEGDETTNEEVADEEAANEEVANDEATNETEGTGK